MGSSDEQPISCPFCGAQSYVSGRLPATKDKTWMQACPMCGRTLRVKVWIRRGLQELIVEPVVPPAAKPTPAAKKPGTKQKKQSRKKAGAKKKPAAKKKTAARRKPKRKR